VVIVSPSPTKPDPFGYGLGGSGWGGLGADVPPSVALEDQAGSQEFAEGAGIKLADPRTLERGGALAGAGG
jgi:hypothetical protein